MNEKVFLLAHNICKTLSAKGYTAFFAGGWVRDLLLDQPTDEIDIATSAPPNIVQQLFAKTIPVGIAFGVVIVVEEGINFEVTTFRTDYNYIDGRHPSHIDFSTPEKDAQRRDFTINGLFYDPQTDAIYDYVGGQQDLKKGIIRAIGDPQERFFEDRLRMIRAVRFAARFDFKIETQTAAAILAFSHTLLPAVSIERIWQEFCKMSVYPRFDQALLMLHQYGLLSAIFGQLQATAFVDIEKKVASFPNFPLKTPPIVFLHELFSDLPLSEQLQLCSYLKTSREDQKIIEFFCRAEHFFLCSNSELCDWAHFYSHSFAQLFLEVCAAKMSPCQRTQFLKEHIQRQHLLKTHIERIQNKKPLVTSFHLQQVGVPPGKNMGLLLKKAERIAINENLQEPNSVLHYLKNEISDL